MKKKAYWYVTGIGQFHRPYRFIYYSYTFGILMKQMFKHKWDQTQNVTSNGHNFNAWKLMNFVPRKINA